MASAPCSPSFHCMGTPKHLPHTPWGQPGPPLTPTHWNFISINMTSEPKLGQGVPQSSQTGCDPGIRNQGQGLGVSQNLPLSRSEARPQVTTMSPALASPQSLGCLPKTSPSWSFCLDQILGRRGDPEAWEQMGQGFLKTPESKARRRSEVVDQVTVPGARPRGRYLRLGPGHPGWPDPSPCGRHPVPMLGSPAAVGRDWAWRGAHGTGR